MDDKKNFKNTVLNRRNFLEYFAALGISSTILPTCSFAAKGDENNITIEMIESAEKLIGIELTEKERKLLVVLDFLSAQKPMVQWFLQLMNVE